MNIYGPTTNMLNPAQLDESAVYSKDKMFNADYLDNGQFNVILIRRDLNIGTFKFISGRWVYIDDFGSKWLTGDEWNSLKIFLQEFNDAKC